MSEHRLGPAKNLLLVNFGLLLLKGTVAFLTGSLAILASLFDTLFDLLGALFAYFGVQEASKPADAEHLYGHSKFEHLASLAQIALIAFAAFVVIFEAVKRLFFPVALAVDLPDLAIVGVTIVIDVFLTQYLNAESKKTGSAALSAAAANYKSDIMQNSAALVGLIAYSAGFQWADPVAAIALGALMLRVSYKVGRKSAGELADVAPDSKTISKIEKEIVSTKGVESFHHLRAKMCDGNIDLDVHVQMDSNLKLRQAHAISEKIKARLKQRFGKRTDAIIHIEPVGDREE